MTEPVVFISEFRVRSGGETPLREAATHAVELIRSAKPGTALYAAYFNGSASTVRFVHAFPDGEALGRHFDGADERAGTVAEILVPAGFELYGRAPAGPTEQLQRDADGAGVLFERFPDAIAGFLRA
jgi:quinol monooxygenase YgiN